APAMHQLAGAATLYVALANSGRMDLWRELDRILQVFVGWSDSMNFEQLGEILRAAGVHELADLREEGVIEQVRQKILKGDVGIQDIRGDLYLSPNGAEQVQLPRSFTFMGQRFAVDSWALSKVVFDSILWPEAESGRLVKVQRRVPSSLDMAFSVLGNNAVVPILSARMRNENGAEFRDGLPYQHNLAAVREVV